MFLLLFSCSYPREYHATEFTSVSPTGKNYIYKISTQGKGGWGPHIRYLYFSSDPDGQYRFPEPKYKIPLESGSEVGTECMQVIWRNNYEATIKYCFDRGIFPKATRFKFEGE